MERHQAYRSNKRIILPVWLISVIVCFLFPARAEQPAAEGTVIFNRYYTVKLQDQHCGYARTAIRQSTSQFTFLNYINMTLDRMGQDVHLVVKNVSREKPTGELISMEMVVLASGLKSIRKAVLDADQLQRLFAMNGVDDRPWAALCTFLQKQRRYKIGIRSIKPESKRVYHAFDAEVLHSHSVHPGSLEDPQPLLKGALTSRPLGRKLHPGRGREHDCRLQPVDITH